MAEIEFRIPGEVQYSYIGIKAEAEELGKLNYEILGALFASALYTTKTGEKDAIARIKEGLTAALPASEVTSGTKSQEEAEELLSEELGASEVDESEAPYKQPPPAAAKKPWDTKKPKPQVDVDLADW